MLVIFSVITSVVYALDCPPAGFISYENMQMLLRSQFLPVLLLDGIDDCYRECISHVECSFFEFITPSGICVRFTREFEESNLFKRSTVTVGVPCEGTENPTEDPSEAPTEDSTANPGEAPTEDSTENPSEAPTEAPTAGPNDCPAEGYFRYPRTDIRLDEHGELVLATFSAPPVDVNDFCNAACSSHPDCGFFQVEADAEACTIFRGALDLSLFSSDSEIFVGVPCCPVQGYVIYSGNIIPNPDQVLVMVELGQEADVDNCNAECSFRQECKFFFVAAKQCAIFGGQFDQNLLSSEPSVIVGVPC